MRDGRIRICLNGDRLMELNQVNAPFQTASLRVDNGPATSAQDRSIMQVIAVVER